MAIAIPIVITIPPLIISDNGYGDRRLFVLIGDGENQTAAMSLVVWLSKIEDHVHTGEGVCLRRPVAFKTIVVGERC